MCALMSAMWEQQFKSKKLRSIWQWTS